MNVEEAISRNVLAFERTSLTMTLRKFFPVSICRLVTGRMSFGMDVDDALVTNFCLSTNRPELNQRS